MKKEAIIVSSIISLFLVSVVVGIAHTRSMNAHAPFESDLIANSRRGIALLHVYSAIHTAEKHALNSPTSSDEIIDQLNAFEEDPRVKALIIRVNSPGGTVGASQELYNAVRRFKANKKIPVIVSIADVGASGAYYMALAADTIFANPGSMVGSIGVMMNSFSIAELSEKVGIKFHTYKSGPYKDILSNYREPSKQEEEMINTMIQNVHQQFVRALIESRNMAPEKAQSIANGSLYSGEQALKKNLVDRLGGFQEALEYAAESAGIKGRPMLIKHESMPFFNFVNMLRNQVFYLFEASLPKFSWPQLR
ncbi:MAG: protease-4 [Candidatus Marinamargulisbacteria bacterium]|jgi:protease-4